jgi:hypothetical protein
MSTGNRMAQVVARLTKDTRRPSFNPIGNYFLVENDELTTCQSFKKTAETAQQTYHLFEQIYAPTEI